MSHKARNTEKEKLASSTLEDLHKKYPGALITEHSSQIEADLYRKYPGAVITAY